MIEFWGSPLERPEQNIPDDQGKGIGTKKTPVRGGLRRFLRVALASLVCLVVVVFAAISGFYFLLQGRADDNSFVLAQVQQTLSGLVGEKYELVLPETELDFSANGNLTISVNDISITRRSDNQIVATIGSANADASIFGLVLGRSSLRELTIKGVLLDAAALSKDAAVPFPPFLDKPVNALGAGLIGIETRLAERKFERIDILDLEIRGAWGGRRADSPIMIKTLRFEHDGQNVLNLNGKLETELSRMSLEADFTSPEAANSILNISLTGLNALEWFAEPNSRDGVVGLDSQIDVSGRFEFDGSGASTKALDPKLLVTLGEGDLRVGREQVTRIASADFNLALYLDRNQIELEPSTFHAERFNSELTGGLKPADETVGYGGPLLYDFIVERATFEPLLPNEPVVPAAFQITGVFDPKERQIDAGKIVLTTYDGALTGNAVIGLAGETPSVTGRLETDGISVLALKQYWPFFLTAKARTWIHDHIIGGRVTRGVAELDIPPGILFRLKQGKKFRPEHLKTFVEVSDFSFRPFGNVTPIEKGKGKIMLEGMEISADLTSGSATGPRGKEVEITSGSFRTPDFAAREKTGEVAIELDGPLDAIARISDREPLRVMKRMKVTGDQFSGTGHANIAAKFPLDGKITYNQIAWNVLLETQNGSSSEPLADRNISHANLLIDANPQGASVTGEAKLDGVSARLRLTEPIGKSGTVGRKRVVSATLSEDDREKLGYDLKPVIRGDVDIEIRQEDGKEIHELDLTKASLSLPWVGWTKGAGVGTSARYLLRQSKGRFKLDDFEIDGPGFGAKGALVLSKQGLQSASLSALRLNENDAINLKVERSDNAYLINATGLSFDARSILNTLIHSGNFKEAEGTKSVNLVANFEQVSGFNNRVLRNALLLYESEKGRMKKLDLSATGNDGQVYSARAQLNSNDTLFSLETNDAGNALAFTDIYTRMEGGNLTASLLQTEQGPFLGPVRITQFNVINEPRLARLASDVKTQVNFEREQAGRNFLTDAKDKVLKFQMADARIERGTGYLNVSQGIIRSATMGLTVEGTVYDKADRTNLSGTFMPANGINLAVSSIPILGTILSNGRDQALIGISYRLRGPRRDPLLEINPLSIVAPGVFNRVFEFR